MATYSPSGILLGLSGDELAALKVIALERIATGAFTTLTGGGKSSTVDYGGLGPRELLIEIAYAQYPSGRVGRVVYDVNRRC